ncbi:LAME_0H05050g1_1 [Lachancea meyersii CBS 8951]|uniref:LAME_0H05050g1_1 n=1 Tax=Lachancea meyersii CBS 8951 TaxID=1266667 RepID=A0A1G4KEE0_9SACH|nr:LAME_0H05050g1_1 [Lachancea meyersii CBS 8951]
MSNGDEILEMFFDEQFAPLGYLDLLLSPDQMPIQDLQPVASSLLSRLDLYTDRLTGQLESKIRRLQKPTELLNYTSTDTQIERTTRLQYYLDTLSKSVKDLKEGIANVNTELEEIKSRSEDSTNTIEALQELSLVKCRLFQVSTCLSDLRSIIVASFEGIEDDEIPQTVSLSDFEDSLKVLGDFVSAEFRKSLAEESSASRNGELLDKIQKYDDLRLAFKHLTKFSNAYDAFVNRIREEAEHYLNKKDMDPAFL